MWLKILCSWCVGWSERRPKTVQNIFSTVVLLAVPYCHTAVRHWVSVKGLFINDFTYFAYIVVSRHLWSTPNMCCAIMLRTSGGDDTVNFFHFSKSLIFFFLKKIEPFHTTNTHRIYLWHCGDSRKKTHDISLLLRAPETVKKYFRRSPNFRCWFFFLHRVSNEALRWNLPPHDHRWARGGLGGVDPLKLLSLCSKTVRDPPKNWFFRGVVPIYAHDALLLPPPGPVDFLPSYMQIFTTSYIGYSLHWVKSMQVYQDTTYFSLMANSSLNSQITGG